MDSQAAEVTDDEASIVAPKISQQTSNKELEGIRPVTPTEEERRFPDFRPAAVLLSEHLLLRSSFLAHITAIYDCSILRLLTNAAFSYDKR